MHLVKKAGYSKKTARTGAVTLIQRFGRSGAPAALNLNIHFHMLFLDGVYVDRLDGSARFRWVSSPTTQELTQLSQTIARRVENWPEDRHSLSGHQCPFRALNRLSSLIRKRPLWCDSCL
jgi:hypothetical protein